jgi:hypothetical protein
MTLTCICGHVSTLLNVPYMTGPLTWECEGEDCRYVYTLAVGVR